MTTIEASRKVWNSSTLPSLNQIDSGSLQRIADAVEKVALNYASLISERNYCKERAERLWQQNQKLRRSYSALRANFTRLKARTQKAK